MEMGQIKYVNSHSTENDIIATLKNLTPCDSMVKQWKQEEMWKNQIPKTTDSKGFDSAQKDKG